MQGSTDAEMVRDCPVSQEGQRHPQKVNLKNTEVVLGYPGNRGMREEPGSPSLHMSWGPRSTVSKAKEESTLRLLVMYADDLGVS